MAYCYIVASSFNAFFRLSSECVRIFKGLNNKPALADDKINWNLFLQKFH